MYETQGYWVTDSVGVMGEKESVAWYVKREKSLRLVVRKSGF